MIVDANFMNKPDNSAYQAVMKYDGLNSWVFCPFCGKKQFKITPGAIIKGQMFKCKGSNCRMDYEVNTK